MKDQDQPSHRSLVSVVIPARNEAENIERVIRLVLEEKPAGVELEIPVVDDGSTDDTAEVAESAGASVLFSVPKARAIQRSHGTGERPPHGGTLCIRWAWLRVGRIEPLFMVPAVLLARLSYSAGMMMGGMRWIRDLGRERLEHRPHWEGAYPAADE